MPTSRITLGDDALLKESTSTDWEGNTRRSGKLYVPVPEDSRPDHKRPYAVMALRGDKALEGRYKLPIPWETIFEGRSFDHDPARPTAADANDADCSIKEKAQMALWALEYDGFGCPWKRHALEDSFIHKFN